MSQVFRVVKALSAAGLKCRSALMTGGEEDAKKRSKSFRTQEELVRWSSGECRPSLSISYDMRLNPSNPSNPSI